VSFPDLLLQQTINGLSLGTMYALLTSASLIFIGAAFPACAAERNRKVA
jgi:branched-subunit amino acid ABC-type transport system permease component